MPDKKITDVSPIVFVILVASAFLVASAMMWIIQTGVPRLANRQAA